MKYPTKFTLIDRTEWDTVPVKVTYKPNTGLYEFVYGPAQGVVTERTEEDVDLLVGCYYDVAVEPATSFPDTLSFYHDTTTQQYNLVKIPHHNLWACSQDGDAFRGATYTAEEIAGHFAAGHWEEVSFSEQPVETVAEAKKERPLTLPFTVDHRDGPQFRLIISEGTDGCVNVTDLDGVLDYNLWTHKECREFIEEGVWIVKSVGTHPQAGVETPPSPSKDLSTLTLTIDSEGLVAAKERVLELATATERLNRALEEFGSLMSDLQTLFAPQQFVGCEHAFCCEEG